MGMQCFLLARCAPLFMESGGMVLMICIHIYIHTQRCRDEMRLQDLDACFVVYVWMYLLVCFSVVRGLLLMLTRSFVMRLRSFCFRGYCSCFMFG